MLKKLKKKAGLSIVYDWLVKSLVKLQKVHKGLRDMNMNR